MIAFIEHHQEKWGWGCSIFNNDDDFDPVGIGEWYYFAGQDKPRYPMPAVRYKAQLGLELVVIKRINPLTELIVKHWFKH